MANYNDFSSMGTTYEFSKGPKSLYYAKGDEDLFGVVLNVPQQDDDDEWGGTNRIAMERVADEIGTLQEYILDPGGGGGGLLDRVTAIEAIVVVGTPQVKVGDITVNGSNNTITIGSDATLDGDDLTLGGSGAFGITEISANRYDITYKRDAIRMFDDGITPTITLRVNTTDYIFGVSTFVVPGITVSGDLTVSGDVNATNGIFTGAIAADTITAATVNATSLVAGTATVCGNLTTLNIIPDVTASRNIGTPGVRYLAVAAENLNIGNAVSPTFTVTGSTGNLVTSGSLTSAGLISSANVTVTGGNVVSNQAVQGSSLVANSSLKLDIIGADPSTPSGGNLLYSKAGGVSSGVFVQTPLGGVAEILSSSTFTSFTSTVTGWSVATYPIYYTRIGKTVIVHFSIQSQSTATTATFTLPVAADATKVSTFYASIFCVDNDVPLTTPGLARIVPATNPNLVECFKLYDGTTLFTNANTKIVGGTIVYEAA